MEPSVLERQRSRSLQWQQEQQSFSIESFLSLQSEGLGNGWPHLSSIMGEEEEEEEMGAVSVCTSSVPVGKEKSKKKRKAEKSVMEVGSNINEAEKKRVKGEGEASGDSSKENSNKKLGYIHVRARRGQATDSHSLAERVRRERISERMKYLQGLVPGCDKITGKAGMLDEIINYVQSLQRQVEFLSMKLATVNPRLDFNMETFFSKEMNMACNSTISTVGMPSELLDPAYLQFNILQQAISCCGLDTAMNQSELDLGRTMSAPVSVPETFLDSCFNVHRPSSGCDNELQSLYGVEFHQGRGPTFPLQSLQGNLLPNNLKMEM